MSKKIMVKLGDINEYKGDTVNPLKYPSQMFELYSVPACDTGNPEIVLGSSIGSAKQRVQKDDILLCKINPRINRVWKVAQHTDYPLIASSEWIVVRSNKVYPQYLYWCLQSKPFREKLVLNVTGIGGSLTRAQPKTVAQYKIPMPSISEQEKIASTLDAVSEVLRLRKAQLAELDNLVKSQFIEMFGDPELNEKGFPKVRLKDCTHINPRKSDDRRLRPSLKVSFVPMSAVSENGELFLSETRLYEEVKTGFTYFAEGDVLFAKITPCMENGKGAIALGLSSGVGFGSTEFHVLRPVHGVTNSHWIYQVLAFRKFRENAAANMTGSAGQRRVPASYLENYTISLPPLELQNRFADIARHVNASKLAIQQSLDETQRLFDSLMAEYFED